MRVFVAGASGAVGRRLLPLLGGAGHDVVGMTSSLAGAEAVRALGAEPALCDALDRDAVRETVASARADAVVHQLTRIPRRIDPRRHAEQFAATNRLRTEGTRNLVEAAAAAGVRRLVAQSIAFAYAPGEGPRSEDDPLFLGAPEPWRDTVAAVAELERQVLGAGGVVLRYGFLYGPGTAYAADGHTAELVRSRGFPLVGSGGGIWSFVHVDDAAGAAAAALERGAPGAYNVADDEPAPVREWLPAYAEALGAPPPRRVPKLLARLTAGGYAVYLMTELAGASNEKARRELGWAPRHASWRDGFAQAAAEAPAGPEAASRAK